MIQPEDFKYKCPGCGKEEELEYERINFLLDEEAYPCEDCGVNITFNTSDLTLRATMVEEYFEEES